MKAGLRLVLPLITLWALCFSCVKTLAADSPDSVITLETDTTRVRFDPAKNGAIVSLVDKARGQEFVEAKGGPLLYELQLFDPANPSAPPVLLSEKDALDATVTKEGQSVVVKVPRHKNSPIGVECRFRTEAGSSFIYARISVNNQSGSSLAGVQFPALSCPRQLGSTAEDDFLAYPRCDGQLVQSPASVESIPDIQYPGPASMQFIALYDKDAGLYLATQDSEGHTKRFGVGKRRETFRPALTHITPLQDHTLWKTEYDTVLGTFHGDWQAAADLYKSWAVHQPWCRQTAKERLESGDIPKWLTEPSLFLTYSLRGDQGKEKGVNRLPLVESHVADWRKMINAPVTLIFTHWEKWASWVGPDCFPPLGDEEAFRQVTSRLYEKGNHSMVFMPNLNWTLSKKADPDQGLLKDLDLTADYQKRGAAGTILGLDGEPVIARHVASQPRARICPATPIARIVLFEAALECQRLGIDCVLADTLVGGGVDICYSSKHDHTPGGGTWAAKTVYDLFDDIRKVGKGRRPDFAFSTEEPGEFFIPVVDIYHARDYTQGRWPRDGDKVIGVPLFTHVYHEFLPAYGGDTCQVWTRKNPVSVYGLGMNLVTGKVPGITESLSDFDPASTEAVQSRLLRGSFDLWRGPAREFLVFGRRVTQPPLDVPSVRFNFWTGQGQPTRELDFPAVLHSTWRLPDGRTGTVLACIASEPVTFQVQGKTITLQPGEAQFIMP